MMVGGKFNFPDSATHPGGDHSPAMEWPGAPAEAKSFAVSLVDMFGMPATADGKFHWILWDIPPTTTSLAADLPKMSPLTMPAELMGAKQLNLTNAKAYFGPGAGGSRPYKFQVWALDVATLPVQNMSLGAIFNLLKMHKIGAVPQFDGVGYK
jgi:Raf kinase inhibitor-like YbhB/YbcL family protein